MNDVSASAGIVYIVGAGPAIRSHATLKGRKLREADVVFHDELLDRRLLDLVSPSCEGLVYVREEEDAPAARSSRSTNKSLSARARTDRRAPQRGDLVFGRGGEEALHFKAGGNPF